VGEIEDVELTSDHMVRVTCSITPRFARYITSDAKAAVVEPPLIGSTKVELTPGESGEIAEDEQVLESFTKADLFEKVDEIEGKLNGVVAKIDSFVDTANHIATAVEERQGLVGRLIYDEALADDAAGMISDLRAITREAKDGKGALGLAISDEEFAQDIKSMAADVRKILNDIEGGQGSLGKLYKDATLVEETEGLITDARSSLKKLDELNADTRRSLGKVEALLEKSTQTMEKVDGLVGNASDVTGELTKSLHKINEGEGTIAAFLNDDALYKETKSLLKELRESVEDLREQAPINSFIGVVFSAF
jgi:phospholipid/cholesterol/gamma-HCH transport system substrate-binding protein